MNAELLDLETQGWNALSSSEEGGAARFYAGLLRADATMLFPGGLVLSGRQEILDSLATQPWSRFEICNVQVHRLTEGAGVLTYRVSALRAGAEPYAALVSSTYVREDGRWQLALHQHTPVA